MRGGGRGRQEEGGVACVGRSRKSYQKRKISRMRKRRRKRRGWRRRTRRRAKRRGKIMKKKKELGYPA